MSPKGEAARKASELRMRAERKIIESGGEAKPLTPDEAFRALHELRVHQIELEMQNEELRRTQEELEKSRRRYFDLYDRAPVGYCSLNEAGVILEANLAAITMLGVTRGELSDWPLSRFIFREDQDVYYLYHKRLTEDRPTPPCELRLVRKDGSTIWVSLEASTALDENDAPFYRVVLTDISERKRAEEERVRLDLHLQQSQKLEAIGRLAGGVAHDFNNMLLVIQGYTEMALERVDPALPLHADLEEVRRAAQRSADLTRQLLGFARKQAVTPQVLDPVVTVEGMLKMLRPLIGEDLEVAWLPGVGVGPVYMDPTQIDQILANLCLNARDAIGGVGKLTIEVANAEFDAKSWADHPEAVPGRYVRIGVTDNGCGIEKALQSQIFEPFFTTKPIGKGTGMGLSTVFGIVQQNRGFIEVDSAPGRGTKIDLYLPRHTGGASASASGPTANPALGGRGTILVVEDEAAILRIATLWLERLGYRVLSAITAQQAIQIAREHAGEIELLMIDVVMPNMNGRDLERELTRVSPGFKSLFISGYIADVILEQGTLEAGTNFLQKPFGMQDLASKVAEILECN